MSEFIAELRRRVAGDGRAVLVTVAHVTGSAPREAGTVMIVAKGGVHGTIGGGHLEFEALRIARDALRDGQDAPAWLVRFPLAARLGQCCGGVATLCFATIARDGCAWLDEAEARERAGEAMDLVTTIGAGIEVRPPSAWHGTARVTTTGTATHIVQTIVPDPFHVCVFGNGHVGRALVRVLGVLPARVRWIDPREADFPPDAPGNVCVVASDVPVAEMRDAPRGSFVVIATHDHALDFDLVATALARDDWRYLGLIGSLSKRRQFEKRLLARGHAAARVARITCPIGAHAGIRSKDPGAIAIAVAAEVLALREHQGSGSCRIDDMNLTLMS